MHLVSSMAFVNETPWHGLGNQLAPNQPIEVWARQAGMDWHIESADVRYVSGNAGTNLGSIHAFPEQKVLYRSDMLMSTQPSTGRITPLTSKAPSAGVHIGHLFT